MKLGLDWRRLRVRNRFLFVISMALLMAFFWSLINQILFVFRAERGNGVVRELRAHDDRCGGKRRHDCTRFFATVEFQSGGNTQTGEVFAGEARGHGKPLARARYKVGDPVPIVFNPDRPEEIYRDEFLEIWIVPLVFLAMQIFFLVSSVRGSKAEDGPVGLELR